MQVEESPRSKRPTWILQEIIPNHIEKVHEAKSRGNQVQASKSCLSAVIQDGLNFSSNEIDNSHEKSAKKIHYKLSSQSFYWGLLQSWVFIGRTDAEAETPILCPPHVKSWLTGKDPDAGRDWGQEEKGMTEDEMAGWHHRLDGHESK